MHENIVPWLISAISLLIAFLTYTRNGTNDVKKETKEEVQDLADITRNLLKANLKLDQVCTNTNETRSDVKSLNKDLQHLDKRLTVVEREVERAFDEIAENRLKGE